METTEKTTELADSSSVEILANEVSYERLEKELTELAYKTNKIPASCRILALQSEGSGGTKNSLKTALNTIGVSYRLISTPDPYVAGVFTREFNSVNLNDFDVIVVGWSGNSFSLKPDANEVTNALIGRKSDLTNWLRCGGGIVALADWLTDHPYQYLPLEVSRAEQNANTVNIVVPRNPVMAGLTSAELSNWFTSYHIIFSSLNPAYEVLARGANDLPVTVSATFGGGKIILTGQDADWHTSFSSPTISAEAAKFLENMLAYACRECAAPTILSHEVDLNQVRCITLCNVEVEQEHICRVTAEVDCHLDSCGDVPIIKVGSPEKSVISLIGDCCQIREDTKIAGVKTADVDATFHICIPVEVRPIGGGSCPASCSTSTTIHFENVFKACAISNCKVAEGFGCCKSVVQTNRQTVRATITFVINTHACVLVDKVDIVRCIP